MKLPLFAALLVSQVVSSTLTIGVGATCRDVVFTVNAAAQNRDFSTLNASDPSQVMEAIQNQAFTTLIPVNGTQTLAGTYCEPNRYTANRNKLQVLFHGITGNRYYWSALGGGSSGYTEYQPLNYSWIDAAHANGYPTLALDRLGAGMSSHPDPVQVVQGAYEFALYHDLAQQIRTGTTGQLDRSFAFLAYIGHSYGSVIGNNMAHLYPNDFNTFVLTGFTKSVIPSLQGVSLQDPEPAAIVNPAKFGNLAPGYLTASNEQGRTNSFFGSHAQVSFDQRAADLFFQREDVVSVGQFISTYADIVEAPEFRGRVLVLTGEEAQAFCGPGSPVLGEANCGSLLEETRALFPGAEYSWKSVGRTGHAMNLHYSAPETFQSAHSFLEGERFTG